jgi:DNA (cytosine-5)-methyltransferase 1
MKENDMSFDGDSYTIANASACLGVSYDTIRRWEKKGLIKPKRLENNRREFSMKELEQLKSKLAGGAGHGYKIHRSTEISPFKVVELFAGAGGLALGLENAGIESILLVEIDKTAAETLKLNRPEWEVRLTDIANVDFAGIEADIITGGFPCQAFSYAGKRLGFEDIRGTLFFEYARAIKEIRPKLIVGENVRGLERHDNGRTLQTMLRILRDLGYVVEYKLLRAQYFDVPQKRERLVIIGKRNDLVTPICFPKEKDYTVSIGEALIDVPESKGQMYTPKKFAVMQRVPEGGCWRDLPLNIQKDYMGKSFYLGGGKTGMARRMAWNEPCLTLTCNPAQKQTERCHPAETRPFKVREYARIQTFPDDWSFAGSVSAQYKQIGNAVPVNLGFHIGRCLVAMLQNTPDRDTMQVLGEVLGEVTG